MNKNNFKLKDGNSKSLTIGWLYPTLMNIYGDRGNIIALQKRCEWRKINVKILKLELGFSTEDLAKCDMLIMGGAQDKQQEKVSEDLFKKRNVVKKIIDSGIPGLYVCGAYQFLGNYYKEANGNVIKGLGIFDLYTKNSGEGKKRLIGNISFDCSTLSYRLLGFENHGGQTYLGIGLKPFGIVIKGFGNNGEDKTEGAIYKNSFGTYLHGPILPKNPKLADYLIEKALEVKNKKKTSLEKLDDSLEEKARMAIAKRLQIAI